MGISVPCIDYSRISYNIKGIKAAEDLNSRCKINQKHMRHNFAIARTHAVVIRWTEKKLSKKTHVPAHFLQTNAKCHMIYEHVFPFIWLLYGEMFLITAIKQNSDHFLKINAEAIRFHYPKQKPKQLLTKYSTYT